MKKLQLFILFALALTTKAQYNVKIEIDSLPNLPKTEAIYLAGEFNGWNPRDEAARLMKNENGRFQVLLTGVKVAAYEVKFTRGGWNTVETNAIGKDIGNRRLLIQSDTSFTLSIAGWKDGFAAKVSRKSTVSPQVRIVDTSFSMTPLNRSRRVWIYFPKDYISSEKSFPVLYMQDGQNLFDDSTSYAGEWGMDETLDSIKASCIVIGIDNGGVKRMNEYNPNDNKQFGKGEGRDYLEFIVKKLKPYVDKRYRTLSDRANTHIAGSSMGGLISFYAGIYYPEVFGSIGVFSPSFWIVPDLKQQLADLPKENAFKKQRYYFYAGGYEGDSLAASIKGAGKLIQERLGAKTTMVIKPEGRHNEASWGIQFPLFFNWIMNAKK
jgi:predicted alpha/beta superfamily hydrolase